MQDTRQVNSTLPEAKTKEGRYYMIFKII